MNFTAFDSAFAAHCMGDSNPMRQYLGLPLQGDCEDCGKERILHAHSTRSLVCADCAVARDMELENFLDRVSHGWAK